MQIIFPQQKLQLRYKIASKYFSILTMLWTKKGIQLFFSLEIQIYTSLVYPIVGILFATNCVLVPTTNPECVIVGQMTHFAGIFIIRIFFPRNNPVAICRGGSHLCHNHFIINLAATSTCTINVFNRPFTAVRRRFSPGPCGFHVNIHLTVCLCFYLSCLEKKVSY